MLHKYKYFNFHLHTKMNSQARLEVNFIYYFYIPSLTSSNLLPCAVLSL